MPKRDDGRRREAEPRDVKAFLPPARFVGAVLFFPSALPAAFP